MKPTFQDHQLLDFHTHSLRHADDSQVNEIVSLHLGQEKPYDQFTIGLHPWWTLEPVTPAQTDLLKAELVRPDCLAMGEMGLDNLKSPAMNEQMDILRSQLAIAQELDMSVVIHCVRATDQLIRVKKEFPHINNWCIHGYSRHATLARQLIDQGFYLSLMPGLPQHKLQDLLQSLPIDRLFLETDSMPDINIRQVYQRVAPLLKLEIADLCRIMNQNARTFFFK